MRNVSIATSSTEWTDESTFTHRLLPQSMAFASAYSMGDVDIEMLHTCEDPRCVGTLALFSLATFLKIELLTFLQTSTLWAYTLISTGTGGLTPWL